MVSKILVPTDGSKPAKKSLEYAVGLALQTGAAITLLAVVNKSAFVPQAIPVASKTSRLTEPIEDYLRRAAEANLIEAAKVCDAHNVPSRGVVRSGHPVEEIVREAQKSKIDLIVIGSHGRSALKAAVLGSVTFGVISKESRIPVLVVRNIQGVK